MFRITLWALAPSLLALGLFSSPAQAQSRVFVAAQGSDSNSCTFAAPCRTFQHAHDIVAPGGEVDVLDPAGYGTVVINKAISIQGHGFAGIAAPGSNAIFVIAGASDKINLRGLLIDGIGTANAGNSGILFNNGASLNVQDCLIRNFSIGISFATNSSTSALFVSNTHIAANEFDGISVGGGGNASGAFDHVIVEGNGEAGMIFRDATLSFTVSNSVISNNTNYGVYVVARGNSAAVVLQNVILSNSPGRALLADGNNAVIRFTKSTITGNNTTFATPNVGQIWSYGDNIIDGNTNNFLPSTTPLH